MFKQCILVSSFILSFLVAFPSGAEPDIVGPYTCDAFNPLENKHYIEDLTISKEGETYRFIWKHPNENFHGAGFFSKQAPDILAIEYWNPERQGRSGVVVYQLQANGDLKGSWAFSNTTMIGSETCIRKVKK